MRLQFCQAWSLSVNPELVKVSFNSSTERVPPCFGGTKRQRHHLDTVQELTCMQNVCSLELINVCFYLKIWTVNKTGWWFQIFFIFTPIRVRWTHVDSCFSKGLVQPPSRRPVQLIDSAWFIVFPASVWSEDFLSSIFLADLMVTKTRSTRSQGLWT